MIRDRDLATYLSCIAEELRGPVRSDVTSAYAQKVVDAIVLVVQRLRSQTEQDRTIGTAHAELWRTLDAKLGSGSAIAAQEAVTPSLALLDSHADHIQARIGNEQDFRTLVHALQDRRDHTRSLVRDASHSIRDLLHSLEGGMRAGGERRGAPSVADDIQTLRERLDAYLQRRFPSLPPHPVTSLVVAPGGQVKRTVLFQLVPNEALPTRLVLRQDMAYSITGTVVTDEFATIKRVYDLGILAPEPILAESDETILGGKFMIMREVVDAQPAGTYFPEERAYLGSAMGPHFGYDVAGALAHLHGRTRETDPKAGRHASAHRSAALRDFETTWAKLGKPSFSLIADLGRAWLHAFPLADDRPHCFIHGDVGAHNMMARDGRLAALLDWELAKMGDPAEDLAQAKMMLLPDVLPWETFKASYIDQGGPPEACDDRAVAYYCIWTYLKHLALNTQLWDYFLRGERDDAPAASIAGHFIDRILLYEARAVAEAFDIVS